MSKQRKISFESLMALALGAVALLALCFGIYMKVVGVKSAKDGVRFLKTQISCFEPIQRFCPEHLMSPRLTKCMIQHAKDIPLECFASISHCGSEILEHCRDFPDPVTKFNICLIERAPQISNECEITEIPCFSDSKKYCAGVPDGSARIDCLVRNASTLKQACLERLYENYPEKFSQPQ